MKLKLLSLAIVSSLFIISAHATVGAVDLFKGTCRGGDTSNSTVCKDQAEIGDNPGIDDNPIYGPNGIITTVTNILTVVVGIGAVISIVYAGTKLIFSGSNPQEANSARERIIYACVALIFVAMAQIIVRFIINRI